MAGPTPPPAQPSWLPEPESTSPLFRLGNGFGIAVVASVLCAIPATVRIAAITVNLSWFKIWGSLAGSVLLPLLLLIAILRNAAHGWRALTRRHHRVRAGAFVWWGALLWFALSVVGAFLRKNTHHHALAGATFGVVGLILAVTIGVIVARTSFWFEDRTVIVQRAFLWSAIAVAFFAVASTLRKLVMADENTALFLDALALLLTSAFAAQRAFSRIRALALAGPPLAALFVFIACTTHRAAPDFRATLSTSAPVYARAGLWLERLTRRPYTLGFARYEVRVKWPAS